MWKPIETALDLPEKHTLETNTLDFKGARADSSLEMAKDVAGFANSQGGTLLVGAYGGDRLEHYKPLTAEEAKSVAAAYDRAVRDRCAPAPLFSVQLIPHEDGIVVAVNVQPFPGQVVGVRMLRRDGMERDSGYFFPVRVGTHTREITPEQLPMFIDAKVRRVAILLTPAIGKDAVVMDGGNFQNTATVEGVDLLQNALNLILNYQDEPDPARQPMSGRYHVRLPLDLVETTCLVGDYWHIYLKGSLDRFHPSPDSPPGIRQLRFLFRR